MFSRHNSLYCPQCGTENEHGSTFCGKCGLKLPSTENQFINSVSQLCQKLITQKFTMEREVAALSFKANQFRQEAENYTQQSQNLVRNYEITKAEYSKHAESLQKDLKDLEQIIKDQIIQLEKLQHEALIYELGFYKPRYAFESSERYRIELERLRERQKNLIRNKEAAICTAEWTVNGSYAQGKRQTNDNLKLMLFAFNGEADVLIAKVKYNNVIESETRIRKVFNLVNKTGIVQQSYITDAYLDLKLAELYLAHEYQEKIYEEKEEQRRIREEIRQEELARRDFEKARIEAEKEENKYEKALEKAKEEVANAGAEQQERLLRQIALLEQRLAEAQANKERAISRAQMTRSGHVYVISNIGSFGENIYKIGMTRRLEPMDRVRELGDASVPFQFDVHAIIYSEDAPKLENLLHRKFNHLRLNQINGRKEFFRVSLDEIAAAVKEAHGEIEFTKVAEAVEFNKTCALIAEGQEPEFICEDNLLEID